MKRILTLSLSVLMLAHLHAQTTSPPVKFAIIPESPEAAELVDRLTVELSGDTRLHLLERAEIEKVYREQGLSAANHNDLKLGQMLGADGLLLLAVTDAGTNRVLDTRLVAVKPGVVLTAEKFSGLGTIADWPTRYAKRVQTFLPKFTVLAKDAVPVSVVNLRSGISSADAVETDRELQTLAIQRLSREPQLFVLERQQLQQLSEEKVLSSDESAFWDGAWLLEGMVDQNGFSKNTVTINARLTPAKGGTPVTLEVTGSRTNLAGVINDLAVKTATALQVTPTVKEWNASDEAAQYFAEAQWALRWGAFKEAQAAADSAWALGKKDLECALARGRACLAELQSESVYYHHGEETMPASFGDQGVRGEISDLQSEHPLMAGYYLAKASGSISIEYAFADKRPSHESISHALRILELYQAFNRASPDGGQKILSPGSAGDNWHNSDWYQLGLDELSAASDVLRAFSLLPDAQNGSPGDLADLRVQTRATAELILQTPSIHDAYYVGDRLASHDELYYAIETKPTIFSSMVNQGCFWQERPEDTVALYRKLLASPVFCYIHAAFWRRDIENPYLVAWNEEDAKHIPAVWNNFLRELDASTNLLWRLEAHAMALANLKDETNAGPAFTNFFNEILTNSSELVANPVEIVNDVWDGEILAKGRNGSVYSELRDQLSRTYHSTYWPQLEAMAREYQDNTAVAAKTASVFEKQKQFLQENQPYDFRTFNDLFQEKSYSQKQAQEILPLIIAYKSNLLANAETMDRIQKIRQQSDARSVEFFLQQDVEKMAHPEPPPQPAPTVQPPVQPSPPPVMATASASRPANPLKPEKADMPTSTNIMAVEKYLAIPLDAFSAGDMSDISITGHHWMDGKLVLDLRYIGEVAAFDEKGSLKSTHNVTEPGIAILDPATEHWQVIPCLPADPLVWYNPIFYHHTTLWHGDLVTSFNGKVRKYEMSKKAWQDLELPDVGNCELFTVGNRLYAANHDLIVEVLREGGMRTLASNRRQPPVSALDTENLGTPVVFPGPGGGLRVATADKIFSGDGTNWTEICALPKATVSSVISDEGVLFMGGGWSYVWRLPADNEQPELCLGQSQNNSRTTTGSPAPKKNRPPWQTPQGIVVGRMPVVSRGTDLWLLAGHSRSEAVTDAPDYDMKAFCFSKGDAKPESVFLKFNATVGKAPLGANLPETGAFPPDAQTSWLCAGGSNLFIGLESPNPPLTYNQQVGVWIIPLDRLDTEVARQKKIQGDGSNRPKPPAAPPQ
jgi:hypothetical protein